jgi:hypothetical protein
MPNDLNILARVQKNGKAQSVASAHDMSFCATSEEALRRKKEYEALNPGSSYIVVGNPR